jgi:uncharacterized membrane protein
VNPEHRNIEAWNIETSIAKLLRIGVVLAGLLIATGWFFQLSFRSDVFAEFATYQTQTINSRLEDLFAASDWPKLIGYLGLSVLVSLPIIRVLMTLVLFIKSRDYLMVVAASIVLLSVAGGILLGFSH